jgi:cell division protein FtsI (penicillin-binding protein 3)
MERKHDVLRRVYLLFFGFLLIAGVLYYQVINISLIEGDKWRQQADSLYIDYLPIEAERGNILADDGSFLATSLQFFDIRVDFKSKAMTDEIFNSNVDSLAHCLSKHVNPSISETSYKNQLIKKRKEGNRYFLIKRKANYKQLDLIRTFPLFREGKYKGGLIIEPRVERIKPYKSLAARTIGAYRENAQKIGLEGFFNDHLKGQEGKRLMQLVSHGNWIPVNDLSELKPVKGMDIQTTIDIGVQDVAHHALLGAVEKHRADFGVAIVMEVKTGKIKAISNLRKVKDGYAEIYNDAIGTRIEPGSMIKLATMMALMEDNLVDLDERVKVSKGAGRFCNRELKDSHPVDFDYTTARHAFEISSNVGMARLVTKRYKEEEKEQLFIDKLRQFHLDKKTGVDIKGEPLPYLKNAGDVKERWSCLSLPWMSMGYELSMTPLQLLSFYNAVANDGKYMKPLLVEAILENREVVQKFKPLVLDKKIASSNTINKAQNLLEGVMLNGTGKDMKLPFAVAGKTGTAQLNYSNKAAKGKQHQAAFVGYFPAEDPIYSCLVVVNNPKAGVYYGSKVAGPVFREIAMKCMNRIPEYFDIAEEVTKKYPLYEVGYKHDIETVLDEAEVRYNSWTDSEWVVLTAKNDSLDLKTRKITRNVVPNVVNMGLKDALFVLENNGFEPKISGRGRVAVQVPEPGSKTEGPIIELTLK